MSKAVKLTPMLQQYLEIKEQHKDTILFYRMGDFYEMFFDDAIHASKLLGITLTSRNKKDDKNQVPMCGVPFHAVDGYLAKLVKAGQRVAICEQVEDPAEAKGIVKREVVKIVSPGVVTDNQLLDDKSNNFAAALTRKDTGKQTLYGISLLDVSTGIFLAGQLSGKATTFDDVIDQLTRLQPSELLLDETDRQLHTPLINHLSAVMPGICITFREPHHFDVESCMDILHDHFHVISMNGFGFPGMDLALTAAGVLLDYSYETQKSDLDHIETITPIEPEQYLLIDDSSRRNLELTQTIVGGNRDGSLLAVLDNCCTPMGSRLLKHRLLFPLRDRTRINDRLDGVNYFYQNSHLRKEIRGLLDSVYDIERLNSRIVLGSANGRDLIAMKKSLQMLPQLKTTLADSAIRKVMDIYEQLDCLEDIADLLQAGINPEPPITLRDGNLIREGYNNELDELISILRDGKQLILNLENQEREKTGISKLKIGFNKVFGYFIEVSKINQDKVPQHYIRKQTLVNAERFITPELKEFENKVLGAEEKRLDLEYKLFTAIRSKLAENSSRLLKSAALIAQLDVLCGLAHCAVNYHYRRPAITDDNEITITEGRHPVIERALPSGKFVPNDVHLDHSKNQVLIITGPNMAGKSTVLRQTALIVLMAQLGSFVPAETASISVVDRIFTRVGAMDDLRRGQSTFMVEMNETANILNNATPESLVILDEIGRGTSTFDGLSIAWAVAEELVTKQGVGVKTMFATHYHELTELAATQSRVQNFSIAVREWNDTIIFLHKLIRGGTNRSYGIQVAGLAGVPNHVVKRAQQILEGIEKGEFTQVTHSLRQNIDTPAPQVHQPNQLSLFSPTENELEQLLHSIDPNSLSPREALDILYQIKEKLDH